MEKCHCITASLSGDFPFIKTNKKKIEICIERYRYKCESIFPSLMSLVRGIPEEKC